MDALLDMKLTVTEREAWQHLMRRDRELSAALTALQADVAAVRESIEARLGLESGAVGDTYLVDVATGRLIERPDEVGE